MDIRKWLDETVQPNIAQSLPKQPGGEPFFRSKRPEPLSKRKRQRKRSKSDSSLLDLPPQRQKTLTPKRKLPTEGRTNGSVHSEATHATRSEPSESGTSSQRYARKPRRKTRPERYEPASKAVKERGKHAHRSRKSESKKSRRKSTHKKGEKQGSGIVQSFHAKNVSGDRLTLKPREQLGIFNKGKTSTAVKGRGLPDLVFSEMKFLQKHKDEPELAPQLGVPKEKRKKDHVHSKEGEISAYFTLVRPALVEKDGNTLRNEGRYVHETLPTVSRRERERSSVVDVALPTIEMPDKASYLGFGTRGPRHESTSYASWSESIRAASTIPARPRTKCSIHTDQLDSRTHGGCGPKPDGDSVSFKCPAPPSLSRQRTEGTAECFAVSSVDPSHHRISRSHSYPQHTSSPRRVDLVDRAAKFQTTDNAGSPSSMPPFVPAHASINAQPARPTINSKYATSLPSNDTVPLHRQPNRTDEGDDIDADPQTSSDLGNVLQQCNVTFHRRCEAATPRRRNAVRINPSYSTNESEQQPNENLFPAIRRTPTVRFAGVESQAPTLPNFAGPSIYEQQAQRRQRPLQPNFEENVHQGSYHIEQDYLTEEAGMAYDNQDWEELPEETMSNGLGRDLGTYDVEDAYVSEDVTAILVPENNVVAPGFWRPNRLY